MNPALVATPTHPLKAWLLAVLLLWFFLAATLSLTGFFDSEPRPPFALGTAAIVPVAVFLIARRGSSSFRQLVRGASLRVLTFAQTWRVAGLLFVALYAHGVLPAVFALPAGWGDLAIGATAPLVAWAISRRKHFPRRLFVAWNILGLLDLVIAVSLGMLASPSRLGILAGDITTRAMGMFPLSLIPTFIVPLLAILHLISLERVRHGIDRVGKSVSICVPAKRPSDGTNNQPTMMETRR